MSKKEKIKSDLIDQINEQRTITFDMSMKDELLDDLEKIKQAITFNTDDLMIRRRLKDAQEKIQKLLAIMHKLFK